MALGSTWMNIWLEVGIATWKHTLDFILYFASEEKKILVKKSVMFQNKNHMVSLDVWTDIWADENVMKELSLWLDEESEITEQYTQNKINDWINKQTNKAIKSI